MDPLFVEFLCLVDVRVALSGWWVLEYGLDVALRLSGRAVIGCRTGLQGSLPLGF